ncbi:MAG: hypothetical protein GF344_11475 [Chitinivibrionales bacterium]|nr:hypothetical protein [Chitinivibrionales bacterium]MBD3357417.1 hypothetical protein [Chitinivibrionales bacterium]
MQLRSIIATGLVALGASAIGYAQEAPIGSPTEKDRKEKKALEELKGELDGKIVWSTSRSNSKHDIWIMNADGTDKKPLTESPNHVDWFSRFSPDGSNVLFVRSKIGWVDEMDAEQNDKWDVWVTKMDGSKEKKLAENACWGTWRPSGDSIVFARGSKVFVKSLDTGDESEIFDAEAFFDKKRVYSQQPELSPDGKFLAITVRGTKRETGIYNRETKEWHGTGGGCQINWFPNSRRVLRMNEGQGNGGTEVLAIKVKDNGEPTTRIRGLRVPKEIRFMDLPGRRSHEYFPVIDKQTSNWMVWCATQKGHAHDIANYEMYIWNINTNKKKDYVRLTFHSGNDRWPDIYVTQ